MKDKKLQNGVEEIRKITMTVDEKKQILDNILNSSFEIKGPIKSPWFNFSLISRLHKNQWAYFVIIPLIFIITGGAAVFASQDSLPDSILYPIKVNIVEPIRGAFNFSQESKAKYEASLATERLVEAETLASSGKLDEINEKKISTLLEDHTKSLNKILNKIDKTKSANKEVDDIVNSFHSDMNEHAKNLDTITNKDKKEGKNKDTQISKTARYNADRIDQRYKNEGGNDNMDYRNNRNNRDD